MLLVGAALVGIGSSVFHPESSRVARLASGGRHGLAQSLFQVGGNVGSALGPLLAAFIVVPHGQGSIAWFSLAALLGMVDPVAGRHLVQQPSHGATRHRPAPPPIAVLARRAHRCGAGGAGGADLLQVLLHGEPHELLHVLPDPDSSASRCRARRSICSCFSAAAAAGTILGGPIGDRFGRKYVIWFSILGVLPFTLALPYADLFWTGVLTSSSG